MKAKTLLASVLAGLLLVLPSCTEKKAPAPSDTEKDLPEETVEKTDNKDTSQSPANASSSENTDHYTVTFSDGRSVTLSSPADGVLASLGEPDTVVEAPSCIHEGYDRVYSFDGFTLTTAPDADGVDRVTEIGISSPACSLDTGLTVGSTVTEMEAAFGTDHSESFGFIKYTLGTAEASFVTDGGVIISILFSEVID